MSLQLHKLKPDTYPSVLDRIEDCIVNAISERAKRKLFLTAYEVAYLDFVYTLDLDERANGKKGWSWKSLTNWKLWTTKEGKSK